MIRAVRCVMTAGVAILCLQAACGKTSTLTCADSIAHACADAKNDCVLTWDQAGLGTAFCDPTQAPPLRADCGPYHAVSFYTVDSGRTYYYDAATGTLAAIVVVHPNPPSTACIAGPSSGFALPLCPNAESMPLPQCLDAGIDGSGGVDGAAN
jgi:hypothetical protein